LVQEEKGLLRVLHPALVQSAGEVQEPLEALLAVWLIWVAWQVLALE
jgi:hypothetical protein